MKKLIIGVAAFLAAAALTAGTPEPLTVKNFDRAYTDLTIQKVANEGGFGQFTHNRELVPLDDQIVMRQNRDTLYSSTVVDLAAGPATLILLKGDGRYVSYQVIDQDGYTYDVYYEPGEYTLCMDDIGTRYVIIGARVLVDPSDPADLEAVHQIQNEMKIIQESKGCIELPTWNSDEVYNLKKALEEPGRYINNFNNGCTRGKDDIEHLFAVSMAYGGMPYEDAIYIHTTS